MFEAIIFVLILFVFIATFIFWCCEKKRDLDTRIIGGAFIAYCFISVFAQLYLLPILAINEWDKRLSLQIQFTALVIGLTAAIIAFRNYQRKSGHDLRYAFYVCDGREIEHTNGVILYNNKDRAIAIFAIDIIVLDTNVRIRLFQSNADPVIVAAYSSAIIKLDETSKYTSGYIPSSFSQDNILCMCITMDGEVPATKANVDLLRREFINTCVFPLALSNIPKSYKQTTVPHNATHWVNLIESYLVYDHEGEPVDMDSSYRVLTGYYYNDILHITPEPAPDNILGMYLHGKTSLEIEQIELHDGQSYENRYFQRYEGIGLMNIKEIQFTEVTKQKPST